MKQLFLVGYMGCGKSSLGHKLAQRLGVLFFDTDTLVEQREGASVADIFLYEGETGFREAEHEVLLQIIAEAKSCVVSTGGGLPVWGDNMELMKGAGCTVYLKRSPEQIARRLSPYGRRKRPKLRGLNDEELIEFMTRNMAEREPFYAVADALVDCDSLSDAELIAKVLCEIDNVK